MVAGSSFERSGWAMVASGAVVATATSGWTSVAASGVAATGVVIVAGVLVGPAARVRALFDAALVSGSVVFLCWVAILGTAMQHPGWPRAYIASMWIAVGAAVGLLALVERRGRDPVLPLIGAGVIAVAATPVTVVLGPALRWPVLLGAALLGGAAALRSRAAGRPPPWPAERQDPLPELFVLICMLAGAGRVLQTGHLEPYLFWNASAAVALLLVRQHRALTQNAALTGTLQAKVETRTAELAVERHRFRSLVQHTSDVLLIVSEHGVVRYHTPSAERILGYDTEALHGTAVTELFDPADADAVTAFLARTTTRAPTATTALRGRMRHGERFWLHVEVTGVNLLADPAVGGVVLTVHDVTERDALERRLRHQAFHDPLTGLANRDLFAHRVTHALTHRATPGRVLAALCLDLDDFKTINDSLGHAAGDELLVVVAQRVGACLAGGDIAARLGGDEFAVLLEAIDDTGAAVDVAERILQALSAPVVLEGKQRTVAASIGVVVHDTAADPSTTADALLRDADVAMYQAKRQGKNTYELFSPRMRQVVLDRLELRSDLAYALDGRQLSVLYQPIFDLVSGMPAAAEALVRWRHPTRGPVPPTTFIPLAEDSGHIVWLGRWVLQQACAQARRWQDAAVDGAGPSINVNLSVHQLHDRELVNDVSEALGRAGLAPECLTLEVTESELMKNTTATRWRLRELQTLGVRIAIDDFGTGYSSLSYLERFPIDVLKIDRSFIAALRGGDPTLVGAIVDLGRSLRVRTVAEGIEHDSQLDQLRAMDCHLAQGFHLGPPMDAERIAGLMGTQWPVALH